MSLLGDLRTLKWLADLGRLVKRLRGAIEKERKMAIDEGKPYDAAVSVWKGTKSLLGGLWIVVGPPLIQALTDGAQMALAYFSNSATVQAGLESGGVSREVAIAISLLLMFLASSGKNWLKNRNKVVAAALLLMLASPASAEDRFKWGAWAGTKTIVTSGQKTEHVFARLAANVQASSKVNLFGRVDASRAQDGGAAPDVLDPRTFRTLEPAAGAYVRLKGRLSAAAVSGVTFSIEGKNGAPLNARQWTGAGGLRYGDATGGSYVYALAGLHGASGPGVKGIVDTQFPLTGAASVAVFVAIAPGDLKRSYGSAGIVARSPWP